MITIQNCRTLAQECASKVTNLPDAGSGSDTVKTGSIQVMFDGPLAPTGTLISYTDPNGVPVSEELITDIVIAVRQGLVVIGHGSTFGVEISGGELINTNSRSHTTVNVTGNCLVTFYS